jgi:hypothetical protein
MKKFGALAFLLFALGSAPVQAIEKEYVILSGSVSLIRWEKFKAQPHDGWWLNFIRASRLRIEELLNLGVPPQDITWLVYAKGYRTRSEQEQRDLIPDILSVRDKYGVKLILFDETSQVIDYLNNGRPRDQVKIADFEYFGHSNRACFMFDYSNEVDSASKVWLHEDELKKIRRGIFSNDAFVKSWGCHSGESMSKKFAQATGVKMWGATGKTQYQTEALPILSTPGGRWTR